MTNEVDARFHYGHCKNKIVSCESCNISVKSENLQHHLTLICLEKEDRCKCLKLMKRKEIKTHDCIPYLINLMATLQNQNVEL